MMIFLEHHSTGVKTRLPIGNYFTSSVSQQNHDLRIQRTFFMLNFNNFLQISKSNVTEFMETWTEQMGYPVIYITRSTAGKGKADQKHFLLDPNANVTEHSKFK